jgi:alkylation response protein AidB-like acyl-CoA dehydrogenase
MLQRAVEEIAKACASSGSPAGSPVFDDVRVPAENVIGEVGRGLGVALGTLERTRLGAAAQAAGIAQGVTDYATTYASERVAFGKPMLDLQAILSAPALLAEQGADRGGLQVAQLGEELSAWGGDVE